MLLPTQDGIQKADVLDGEAEDLVLGELFVRGMRWDEAAELGEGSAHVLLAPALAGVGEQLAGAAQTRGGFSTSRGSWGC